MIDDHLKQLREKIDENQKHVAELEAIKERQELDKLREAFKYHAPEQDQVYKYQCLREAALNFALTIRKMCPDCADRSTAIRKVREACFTANASIALKGRV